MKKRLTTAGIALSLMLLSLSAQALPQAYNISWSGNGGYSLAGMFTYDQSGSGLGSFMMEGFSGSNSLGVFNGTPELFMFDSASGSLTSLLQGWNVSSGQGPSFGCFLTVCGLGIDGSAIKDSITFLTHIDVSPKTIEGGAGGQGLSAPTGILALLVGLMAFAFRRRASS